MENKLLTIQMLPEELNFYQNCRKELKDSKKKEELREEQISSLRDQYYNEFNERQKWAKRSMFAEKKLDELLDIVHSDMPAKLKLETLTFKIEEIYKDKGYKHD